MNTRASGHDQRENDLISARCIRQADFHSVEVAANIGSIYVSDWNVQSCSRTANFFRRSDNCFRAAQQLAHAVSAGNMPKRSMLDFARRTDDRSFAVPFDLASIAAQGGDEVLGHLQSEWLQIVHKTRDLRDIGARERIVNHSQQS